MSRQNEMMIAHTDVDHQPETRPAKNRKPRLRRSCMDCGKRHQLEYYMLGNKLWDRITRVHERHGELCLACVETRLGRPLKPRDFRFTPFEMEVRFWLPRGGKRAWDAVLGRRRTRHRLFQKLAAGATSIEEIAERIMVYSGRAPARHHRDQVSPDHQPETWPAKNRLSKALPPLVIQIVSGDGTEEFDVVGILTQMLDYQRDFVPLPDERSELSGEPAIICRSGDLQMRLSPPELRHLVTFGLQRRVITFGLQRLVRPAPAARG